MDSNVFFANPGQDYQGPTLSTADVFSHQAVIQGIFHVEVIRKGQTIFEEDFNATTNEGLNNMLGVTFHGDTQQTAWYALLISNSSYSALSASDVMSSHTGWTECIAYSETTRQQWTCGSPASKSITNATAMTFTISVDNTIVKGIAIASDSTKSGTTGKLWSTGLFSADQTFLNGDQLKVTYTVNIS
jgi:hypothetical protein